MEAAVFTETLAQIYQTTWCYIAENRKWNPRKYSLCSDVQQGHHIYRNGKSCKARQSGRNRRNTLGPMITEHNLYVGLHTQRTNWVLLDKWRRVIQYKSADVSKEYFASIFRVSLFSETPVNFCQTAGRHIEDDFLSSSNLVLPNASWQHVAVTSQTGNRKEFSWPEHDCIHT